LKFSLTDLYFFAQTPSKTLKDFCSNRTCWCWKLQFVLTTSQPHVTSQLQEDESLILPWNDFVLPPLVDHQNLSHLLSLDWTFLFFLFFNYPGRKMTIFELDSENLRAERRLEDGNSAFSPVPSIFQGGSLLHFWAVIINKIFFHISFSLWDNFCLP
jgi:hypothetical protein